MATDTILEVGAIIDLTQILPGLDTVATATQTATSQMASSMTTLTTVSQADSTALLQAFDSLKLSIDELAETTETSTAVVQAAMAKMASGVRVSAAEAGLGLAALRKDFTELAASAELSAVGAVNSLGPLGAIFGVGILTNYVEKLKEATLQVARLSDLTGISVSRIVQFRGAMEELGVPTTNLSRLLVHLSTTMKEAADGQKAAQEGFKQLGVDTEGWAKKLPDGIDVLLKMSDHLHAVKGGSEEAAAAGHVLGQRLGIELAGGLTVGSQAILERMKRLEGLGDAEQKEVADALRLQEEEAKASAKLQETLLPLIGFFADFIGTVRLLWNALASDVTDAVYVIAASFYSIGTSIEGTLEVLRHLATFDFSGAKSTMQAYANDLGNIWHNFGTRITNENKGINAAITDLLKPGTLPIHGGADDPEATIAAGNTRVQAWRESLEAIKADSASFRSTTAAEEVAFWQNILATQKLSAKERLEVEKELNAAKHQAAVEHYQEMIALDQELITTARAGSAARLAAVTKERDDTVAAVKDSVDKQLAEINRLRAAGAITESQHTAMVRQLTTIDVNSTKEVLEANRKVFEEQINGDKQVAADVATTVAKQTEAYATGSAERIAIVAAGIAQLKVMQDNLAAGKTAGGAAEPTAPIGPSPDADSQLRVQARQTESADIQKIVDTLTGRLSEDYRSETSELFKQTLEQEKIRLDAISQAAVGEKLVVDASKRTTAELIADARSRATASITEAEKSADGQIRELEKLASYHLITENQRVALSRQVLNAEQQATMAEIAQKIDAVKAEQQATLATIQQEKIKQSAYLSTAEVEVQAQAAILKANQAADEQIKLLLKQLEQVYQQLDQKRKQLDDDATNYQIQNAEKAATVISNAFAQAFDKMITSGKTFHQTMQQLWIGIVQGFEKMVVQMVANWIKAIATQVLYTIIGQQAQTGAVVAGQAAQTAAATAGAGARTGIGLIEDLKSIGSAAATAAAHAFKWVMQEVPFPANAVLAPVAAAAAFAGVLAFKSLASAAQGALLDKDTLVQAHANEMILPAPISRGLQGVIASGGAFAPPPSLVQAFAPEGNTRSTTTVTNTNKTINVKPNITFNHSSLSPGTTQQDIVAAVKQAVRSGALKS